MAGTLLDGGGPGLEESMRKLENDAAADASLAALKGEGKMEDDEKTGAR